MDNIQFVEIFVHVIIAPPTISCNNGFHWANSWDLQQIWPMWSNHLLYNLWYKWFKLKLKKYDKYFETFHGFVDFRTFPVQVAPIFKVAILLFGLFSRPCTHYTWPKWCHASPFFSSISLKFALMTHFLDDIIN